MLAEDENKRQREQIAALTAENVRLRAICAESRDHLLLVLPGIESYASASPVMVSRAANARAMLRNLEARDALAREGKP